MANHSESQRLFSYIVTSDTGLAPNPYWDFCTLSCCKPQIRAHAEVGDLVVGLSSVRLGPHKIIYSMYVTETLDFKEYFLDQRFRKKIPIPASPVTIQRLGDNFYQPITDGFRQLPSRHSLPNGQENVFHKNRDLSGRHVLISENFCYLGDQNVSLPPELSFLRVRRGHRNRFTPEQKALTRSFIETLPPGRIGQPSTV